MRAGHDWTVTFTAAAQQALANLPPMVRGDVFDVIRDLADDPEPPESLPMSGKAQGMRRLRIGAYRVVYRAQPARRSVMILRVGHRNDVYRGLGPRPRRKRS